MAGENAHSALKGGCARAARNYERDTNSYCDQFLRSFISLASRYVKRKKKKEREKKRKEKPISNSERTHDSNSDRDPWDTCYVYFDIFP